METKSTTQTNIWTQRVQNLKCSGLSKNDKSRLPAFYFWRQFLAICSDEFLLSLVSSLQLRNFDKKITSPNHSDYFSFSNIDARNYRICHIILVDLWHVWHTHILDSSDWGLGQRNGDWRKSTIATRTKPWHGKKFQTPQIDEQMSELRPFKLWSTLVCRKTRISYAQLIW